MKLDHLDAEFAGGIDLFERWIDKETDANASGLQSLYRRFKFRAWGQDIESTFRCYFLPFFRNETDFDGHNAQGNIDNVRRVPHFQIQLRHDVFAQPFDVAVLHVAAIAAQMRHDSVRAGALADGGGRNDIWLGVL